jgi:hypothetical protein
MLQTVPTTVLLEGLRIGGGLQGIAFHREGMPRRERARVQSADPRLVRALRHGLVPEDLCDRAFALRVSGNLITTAGKNYLVDCWQGTVEPEIMKFHANGSGATAAAIGDTALQTEYTTQYNPDNTRATGTLAEGASANIFRTVGTNAFDAAGLNVTEWGLLNQSATGGGVLFSRVVFAAIPVGVGDSIQWTYECTVS